MTARKALRTHPAGTGNSSRTADVTGGRDRRRPGLRAQGSGLRAQGSGLRAETEAEAGLRPFLWDMAHLEQSNSGFS